VISAQPEDIRRAREEYQQLVSSFDYAAFIARCKAGSRLLIENSRDGAAYIAGEALRSLSAGDAFMMLRIGDGEANLVRFAADEGSFETKWINALFRMHDNQILGSEDSRMIARDLLESINQADVVGLRPLCPAPIGQHLDAIAQTIDAGDVRGALGMIEAFRQADRALANREFRHAVLTSAWVHLTLLEHLDRLLDNAQRVIVITGRQELGSLFSDKLQGRLTAFLTIPLQASDQASPERGFHYPHRYRQIIDALAGDLHGTLVLVGAGIFGKKYCAIAKHNGAVALDLGSAFDILAGKRTRPVHSLAQFLDSSRQNWITVKAG
jgi:hypothetical protein